jgi:tetratricopeptide (TPR) repeat protein
VISRFRLLWPLLLLPIWLVPGAYTSQDGRACSETEFLSSYATALELFISKQYSQSSRVFTTLLSCKLSRKHVAAIHLNLGRNYQELGQKELALQSFSNALRLDATSFQAFTNRGLVLASLGRLDDANRDFSQALRIAPSNFIALSNRGVAYATQGKFSDALKDFDMSIKLNPSYGEAYINRGIVRELAGDIRGACSDWKRAIQLRQFSARSWVAQQCD